jgi:ankyrin repeat protein
MVMELLTMGADLNPRDRMDGTPLDDAIRERHYKTMEMLCESGARPEGIKVAIRLCDAASTGDVNLIKLLCERGADPNVGDYDHRTCLHLAASVGSVSVVDLLLKKPGMELNPVDRFGGTPLDDAYRHGNRQCIFMLQLVGGKRGTDPEVIADARKKEQVRTG